jgi:F420-non-reducing hydrogenase iron-sulfur subunit
MTNENFEPLLIAFCCQYCSYSAADLAGSMRLQYPPNVRIIRTPCTGRLEAEFFMKAFERGADGILVAGCLEGGCHFTEGNLLAKRRVGYTRTFLSESGLAEERIRMINISAAQARPLVDAINEMLAVLKKLGPSPLTNTNPSNKAEMRL